MEDYIKRSIWFQKGEMEPFVGDNGVPPCAVLLARQGESVYRCFVATKKDGKGKHVHHCIACGFKSKRLHRVIGHQRYKRGHSPFVCPDKGWYVHSLPHLPYFPVWQLINPPIPCLLVVFLVDILWSAWMTIGLVERPADL